MDLGLLTVIPKMNIFVRSSELLLILLSVLEVQVRTKYRYTLNLSPLKSPNATTISSFFSRNVPASCNELPVNRLRGNGIFQHAPFLVFEDPLRLYLRLSAAGLFPSLCHSTCLHLFLKPSFMRNPITTTTSLLPSPQLSNILDPKSLMGDPASELVNHTTGHL